MPPKSKSNARKGKRVDTAPSKKQLWKVANLAQGPATLQRDLVDMENESTGDQALSAPIQGMVNQMDNNDGHDFRTVTKGHGQDTLEPELTAEPIASPSTSHLAGKRA